MTADHNIEALVDELPTDDPWRAKPRAAYATTYRYPSPTGKRKCGPTNEEVLVWIKTIAGLTAEARDAVAASKPPDQRTARIMFLSASARTSII